MGTMRNQWDPVLGRRAIQVDQQRARRPCPRCWRLRLSSPDFPGLPTFPHPRLLQTPGTPASAELSRARVQLIYLRRTAYVRVYVAVCLAVFFLSPHFSKREGTPEIRAMASRIICWRQDAKRLPPPLPIHFLSAQHRLHLAAGLFLLLLLVVPANIVPDDDQREALLPTTTRARARAQRHLLRPGPSCRDF